MKSSLKLLVLLGLIGGIARAADEDGPLLSKKSTATAVARKVSAQELAEFTDQLHKTEKKIAITTAEIKRVRDTEFLPDLYFSLAELHLHKSRLMYLIKVGKNKGTPITELDFTAEKRPKLEAIEIYQKIYAFFPKSKLRDRAMFFKALELRDIGQNEQMLKSFGQLNKEFPDSPYLREANIILGDYFLEEKKDVEGALEVFRRVVAKELSPYTPLAHYRIGWCFINLQKYREAVSAFEEAVRTQSLMGADAAIELPELYRKTDIKREAILSMAVPYVEIYAEYKASLKDDAGKPNGKATLAPVLPPNDYFRRISDSHLTYRKVLARVGRRLALKEMWVDVGDVWTEVLISNSDPEVKFEAIQRWAEAVRKATSKTNRLKLIEHAVMTAQEIRARASVVKNPKKDAKAKEQRQLKFLELVTRDIATRIQQAARETSGTEGFALAARAYEFYQIGFPQNTSLQAMLLNKAESLFRAEQWTKAGLEFEQLARVAKDRKKKAEFKESAIQAYANALKDPDKLSPLDLVRSRRAVREVGTDWVLSHMKHPAASSTAYNIGQSWYEDRLLPQAIQAFTFFVKNFPRDERIRDAIFSIINAYSQLDDLKGLVTAAKTLEQTKGLSAEDRQAIRESSRRAQLKEIQTNAGDFGSKKYAESLVAQASKYKDSTMGAAALYEAFTSLRSKRDPELYEVGAALLDKYTDSTYTKEVVSSMAQTALMTADFERAAQYLSRFSDKYPNEKESSEWRRNSAQIYDWLGKFEDAKRLYAALGNTEAVIRCEFSTGDWPALEKTSQKVSGVSRDYHYGLSLWRQGRQADALPSFKAVAAKGTSGADLDKAAQARFFMAQRALESFRSIKMKDGADQAALVAKIKAFQALAKELNDIVKVGVGRWTIASLYLLGQANFDLGRFIANSPLPAGLQPKEVTIYKAELTKNAKQYVEAANQVFGQCLTTAEKFEVFTRYVQGCRDRGRMVVQEEADTIKANQSKKMTVPAAARPIRNKLYDSPRDVQALEDLAKVYMKDSQPWVAQAIYNRILEIDEKNPRAMAGIGVAKLYVNDLDGAAIWFKKALAIDANEPVAVWNLSGLYADFNFTALQKMYASKRAKIPKSKVPLLHPMTKSI